MIPLTQRKRERKIDTLSLRVRKRERETANVKTVGVKNTSVNDPAV